MFLVVLSWLAFLMESSDIADRLALEITMILSIVFLHGGINTSLPHVSYAKASDWFVIVSFSFIFMALLETMFVYRISLMATRTQSKRKLSVSFRYSFLLHGFVHSSSFAQTFSKISKDVFINPSFKLIIQLR